MVVWEQPADGVQEDELFTAALALPASERASYLGRACRNNLDLFGRVLERVDAVGDAATALNNARTPATGADRIGHYRLLGELGEGGCGVAYLAEQKSPVKRHVAVKIIKPG